MNVKNYASTGLFYILVILIFIAATYLGSEVTSVVSQLIPVERCHTIIIDAGHGGVDGGATSCTGRVESSYNLEIALRLNDLMHLMGIHTKMVRTTDISIYTQGETIAAKKVSDLRNRVTLVNETENALLLSIHQNTFPESQYSGAQVFYAATDGSRTLAQEVQNELRTALNNDNRRGVKEASSVYLMQHINCVGILVECGFLSNPEEAHLLQQDVYQKKLVCAVCGAVSRYLEGTKQNEV